MKSALISLFKIAIALTILTLFYTGIALTESINSDSASMFLQSLDVSKGNIFLHGWSLSTVSFYVTEIIPHAIAITIFGFNSIIMYWVTGLLYAILVILAFRMIKERSGVSIAILSLSIMLVPGLTLKNSVLVAAIHVGSYILTLLSFILSEKLIYAQKHKNLIFSMLCVTLSLSLLSDTLCIFMEFIPLIIAATINLFYKKEKSYCYIIAACVLSVVIKKLITLFIGYIDGFYVPGSPSAEFSQFDDIGNRIYLLVTGTINLFNAHIFGEHVIRLHSFSLEIHFFVMLSVLGLFIIQTIKSIINKKIYLINLTLQIAITTIVMAYIFSTMAVGPHTVRYLIPAMLFTLIYVGRNIHIKNKNLKILALIAGIFICTSNFSKISTKIPDNDLAIFLEKNELSCGYSTFWLSSATTVASNNKIQLIPVNYDKENIGELNWLSNKSWYKMNTNFIVTSKDNTILINAIAKQYGTPQKTLLFNSNIVYIWDKDLSKDLKEKDFFKEQNLSY